MVYSQYLVEAFETAIEGLKKLEQYVELGTVEELQKEKEKRTPKQIQKRYIKDINGDVVDTSCYCPSCEQYIAEEIELCDYCPECGQALDWSLS